MTGTTPLERLLEAGEPQDARRLASLVTRLRGLTARTKLIPAAAGLGAGEAVADGLVRGLTSDSRAIVPGMVFVAVPGLHADGHRFVAAAVAAGAAAAVVERPEERLTVPQIVVPDSRRALAEVAAWWYGDPSRQLGVVGITGTDGKTTTGFLAAGALAGAGIATGLLGTVATQVGGIREANREHSTTPEAPQLQRALQAMVVAGDGAAIVETTSHGLALERVAAIGYDVAIFTNLSHEHLELHGTFEAYRDAKRSLFERLAAGPANPPKPGVGWPRTGIVNADDPAAGLFAAATRKAGAALLTYGRADRADIRLLDASDERDSLRLRYRARDGNADLRLRLRGRFNAWNALAAVALGQAIGLDPAAVRAGLEGVDPVPGRMEVVDRGQPFRVVVDYAHSPASLALVLDELGPAARAAGGSLIAVFGSAGERDRDKRPMMGRIAAERCRVVVVTDEDPRAEDRSAILAEIAEGARSAAARPDAVLEIADRRAAIREAFTLARPGDTVLLAGKGHETTILYAHHAEPWNERAEAEAALGTLGWHG